MTKELFELVVRTLELLNKKSLFNVALSTKYKTVNIYCFGLLYKSDPYSSNKRRDFQSNWISFENNSRNYNIKFSIKMDRDVITNVKDYYIPKAHYDIWPAVTSMIKFRKGSAFQFNRISL